MELRNNLRNEQTKNKTLTDEVEKLRHKISKQEKKLVKENEKLRRTEAVVVELRKGARSDPVPGEKEFSAVIEKPPSFLCDSTDSTKSLDSNELSAIEEQHGIILGLFAKLEEKERQCKEMERNALQSVHASTVLYNELRKTRQHLQCLELEVERLRARKEARRAEKRSLRSERSTVPQVEYGLTAQTQPGSVLYPFNLSLK